MHTDRRWSEWATKPHLPWSSSLVLLRAASSAHYCPHMSVQPHTAPTSSSNLLMTTVIGLITDNDETAYREEVSTMTKWCQENHLSLNIDKTKELVVDFRRQEQRTHTHHHRQDTCGACKQLYVPRRSHHRGSHMVC